MLSWAALAAVPAEVVTPAVGLYYPTLSDRIADVWGERGVQWQLSAPSIESRILQLSPHNDSQRWLHSQAPQIVRDVMEARRAILDSLLSSIPVPFLVTMVFWLALFL